MELLQTGKEFQEPESSFDNTVSSATLRHQEEKKEEKRYYLDPEQGTAQGTQKTEWTQTEGKLEVTATPD